MGKESFSTEVTTHIEKIVRITERIAEDPVSLPFIEIDFGLEEIRRLYDLFLALRRSALLGESKEVSIGNVVSSDEDTVLVGESKTLNTEDVVSSDGDTVPVEVSDKDELVQKDIDPASEQEMKTVEVNPKGSKKRPEIQEVKENEKGEGDIRPLVSGNEAERESDSPKTPLGERLKHGEVKSIHDIIAARRSDVSISARLQQHPISDLRSAIGINEKFIFVYELFGGNVPLYNEAIERLNRMDRREEAIELMEQYRAEYHWDIENMAFQKLVDMISRRYS